MSARTLSAGNLIRLFAVLIGLAVLAGCGGSSSTTTTTGTPAITLSATTLTFSSGVNIASAAQSVTVTDSGTASLTFSGITASTGFSQTNTCGTGISAGATCSISVTFTPTAAGAATGTLTINDNASGSPQSVSLSGTGTSVSVSPTSLTFSPSTTTGSATLNNSGSSSVAITSISVTSGSSNFNESNTCGATLASSGSCSISVTFTPPASGTVTGVLTIVEAAGTLTVNLSGSAAGANTASLTVSFGPNGYQGPPAASATSETLSYYNDITTTVTICEPGSTTSCVTVPNVLVDTGSVGLRVLASQLTSLTLPVLNDGSGNNENECVTYGDGSFNWGPIELASVQIGGESALQVPASAGGTANAGIPIQFISGDTVPTAVQDAGQCVVPTGSTATNTPDEYTVETLGVDGILGIGAEPTDCTFAGSNYCTTAAGAMQLQTYPYWFCSTAGDCTQETVVAQNQVWNPVAAFSSTDTNGVVLSLPSVPAAGAATVTGSLIFGIGTQSNNALGAATVYEQDADGNFASATLSGVTYNSTNSGGAFIDSGSNALYVSDASTLGTTDCTVSGYDIGLYCPGSPLAISLGLTGSNGTSGTVSLSIGNALDLFSANTSFAAFSNLGAASCVAVTGSPCTGVTPSPDYFDLGMPFFFGQPNGVFVGIAGGTTYPSGYYAF